MLIFVLRLIIFTGLVVLGFWLSVRSIAARKIVTDVYVLTLLWYTFLCRLPLFTAVPTYGEPTTPAQNVEVSQAEKFLQLIKSIFGAQPDGTLAGRGLIPALVMNALLFVPLGYLISIWFPRLRERRFGWIGAVLITVAVSVVIETIQELTGLGMADGYDVLGNSIGGMIGVGMVRLWERKNG